MNLDDFDAATLWRLYQRGYPVLLRSGRFFRQVVRPALSHVYFQRAVPLLLEYARANRGTADLPPGFGDQMEACPLTARDLLHLDYTICLGFAEERAGPFGVNAMPVLEWPGPEGSGLFIAADAVVVATNVSEDDYAEFVEDDDETDGGGPSFDL